VRIGLPAVSPGVVDMNLNFRKLIVGLAVLAVLLGLYVGYTRLGGDAPIKMRPTPRPGPNDLAVMPSQGEGKIGQTTIEGIHNTRLINRDASGRIDRDFGFDDLYHNQGDQWVATRPFMTMYLYQSGFKCSVTADKAQVKMEGSAERLIPNDAAFSGHVVIHIAPSEPNEAREAFIYLDDVVFTAEKSLFSTSGPVKFVSHSARLVGQGMELLYDEERQRLELFSIRNLDSLRLRSEVFDLLSASPPTSSENTSVKPGGNPAEPRPVANALRQTRYECVLRDNVQIVTPDKIIRAIDWLSITDILWAGSAIGESSPVKAAPAASNVRRNAEPNESENLPVSGNQAMSTTGSNAMAFELLPDSLFDIVVTCRGGFVVRPMGETPPGRAAVKGVSGQVVFDPNVAVDPLHQVLIARHIDVNAVTRNALLAGPVRTSFLVDPNNLFSANNLARKVLVTVDAEKEARFLSASNRIVLDGNCVVTSRSTEPNDVTTETVVRSPMLTFDLVEDANAGGKNAGTGSPAWGPALKPRRAVASGGSATLQVLQKTPLGLVGWVELKGKQFDYDGEQGRFTVLGPGGQVSIYNSKDLRAKGESSQFSLRQPCYAFLRGFDHLTYSATSNQIVADSKSKQLQLDYFPLEKGRVNRHFQADVGHVETELARVAGNRTELATLTASEGIAFREGVEQFDGLTLFYDRRTDLMTVRGSESRPCYLNGWLVDEIEMNAGTGRVKAKVMATSTIGGK
jgi:lipopolysaccharide export system protein LptC